MCLPRPVLHRETAAAHRGPPASQTAAPPPSSSLPAPNATTGSSSPNSRPRMQFVFLNSFSAEGILSKAASLANEPLLHAWGLEEKVESLRQTLSIIQNITRNVAEEPQDCPEAALKLKDLAHDADDVLDEISYEVFRHKLEIQNHMKKKVLNFFSLSNPLVFRLKMTYKIKNINASLVDLTSFIGRGYSEKIDPVPQVIRSHRAFLNEETIGREEVVSNIVTTLTNSNVNQEQRLLPVMAIVGMPGVGKTTLARSVYNEDSLDKYFDKKIWVEVSNNFDVKSILICILECLDRTEATIVDQDAIVECIREELKETRCLLVLDDVWIWNEDSEKWKILMTCLSGANFTPGSTIIVTTRNTKVATLVGTLPCCNLRMLSGDECWSILKGEAFPDSSAPIDPGLEEVGREIAKKCAGLPLLAKVLGGILRSKNSADEWLSVSKSRLWDLPEEKDIIIRTLKLSFDHLKSPFLKQCFIYCAMIKKESEIEKDDLIQLWMAQGLLQPSYENRELEMEDIGHEYYNILLESSLLQELTKDDFAAVAKCNMHVLLHDFAELVSKFEGMTRDSNEMDGKVKTRHVAHIPSSDLAKLPKRSVRGFRSLFSNEDVPSKLLLRFRALHVLNLYKADIKELPISIGKLKQLRYLNVSGTEIKTLPKSIGKLHYLQTLRMEYCKRLKVFPKEVGDLINLRHIYFGPVQQKRRVNYGWQRESHVEVGQLSNLRTICYFVVSKDQIGRGIEELEGLNHLKGELIIYDLEHVRDGEEAKKANLGEKRNIRKLSLVWGEEMRVSNDTEDDVLEALQPHPNLEILEIHNFMGAKFPSWKPLNNLKEIRLVQWDVCDEVSMLGCLPNLMHLGFDTMSKLRQLGTAFYGHYNDADDAVDARSTEETISKATFPALKTLRISAAPNLIEWMEAPVVPTEQMEVFPCLEELNLVECPQLKNIPLHFPSLRQMEISMCHEISSLSCQLQNCTSLRNLGISNCDSLTSISLFGLISIHKLVISSSGGLTSIDGQSGPKLYTPVSLEELLIKCTSLHDLEISNCDNLISISIQGLTSLRRLKITSCGGVRSMEMQSPPECYYTHLEELSIKCCKSLESFPNLHGCTSLIKLTIADCDGLTSIGQCGLESCTSLSLLHVRRCQNLRHLADELDTQSLHSLCIQDCQNLRDLAGGFNNLSCIKELTVRNCPNLSSLLSGLGDCTSLLELRISGFHNLTSIPLPTSLLKLVIEDCAELSSIPGGLESLEELSIGYCSKLKRIGPYGNLTSLRKLVFETGGLELSIISIKHLEEICLDGCTCLRALCINDCPNLSRLSAHEISLETLELIRCPKLDGVFPSLDKLTSLVHLTIWNFDGLTCIPFGKCTSLTFLSIFDWNNVKSMADQDLSRLQSLSLLDITCCRKLQHLPAGLHALTGLKTVALGRFSEELDSFPDFQTESQIVVLKIIGWPKLKSLPQQIQHFTSLTHLTIQSFTRVEAFPEWLGDLTSLTHLSIWRCQQMKYLPTVKAMQRLVKLENLTIYKCPLLQKRCAKESGPEWPKISHIPNIAFDRWIS